MTETEPACTIRRMEEAEYEATRTVAVAAFSDESIGDLIDGLRASWAWCPDEVYVATRNEELVYSSAILDAPDRLVDVLVLSPVGVRPDLHGRGIGSQLIKESLRSVAERPEPLVFLEGSPRFYPRFGFRPGGELGFLKPSARIPDPAFQVCPLTESALELSGQLVYPDVFWRQDAVGLR